MRARTLRRGGWEWLVLGGIVLLVAVGAAAAATRGLRHPARTVSTVRAPAPPRPVGDLAIGNVRVTTRASSAVVRWHTSVPATSYLAFRLGSLGLTASTPGRRGVSHVGILRDLRKNTVYHLWIVATRGASTIRRAALVAVPRH